MRPASRLLTLLTLTLLATACRDEQAGPKPRTKALPPPAQARVLDAAPGDLTYRSGATFAGGAVRYLGTRVTPPVAVPGQAVKLEHYFEAVRAVPRGWKFFMHVVDPASGQMMVNADHDFAGGAAPLGTWPVGKVVEDVHTVPMPPAPGRVVLGFWQGDERLAVDEPNAHAGDNRMMGPQLGGGAPPLPEYTARRASQAPVIDGALDDAVWKDAAPVVLRGSFDGRQPSLRTEARLAYDDQHLYVAFDVEDPDIWGTLRERDDAHLRAGGGGDLPRRQRGRAHLQRDAGVPAQRQLRRVLPRAPAGDGPELGLGDEDGGEGARHAGQPEDRDEGWRVEMRIPFARLAEVPNVPPKKGERWRFNLYRLEHVGRQQVEGQSFSPLFVGDFHALPRFGWLVFE